MEGAKYPVSSVQGVIAGDTRYLIPSSLLRPRKARVCDSGLGGFCPFESRGPNVYCPSSKTYTFKACGLVFRG